VVSGRGVSETGVLEMMRGMEPSNADVCRQERSW
jgi:hypothetical protein